MHCTITLIIQANTFQVILATNGQQTYALFLYRDIQWGRGRSTIGFNAGDGIRSYALNTNNSELLKFNSNVGVPGMYIFKVDEAYVFLPPGELQDLK